MALCPFALFSLSFPFFFLAGRIFSTYYPVLVLWTGARGEIPRSACGENGKPKKNYLPTLSFDGGWWGGKGSMIGWFGWCGTHILIVKGSWAVGI